MDSRAVSTAAHTSHCLFQEPWWLDAVAPGQWSAVEVREGDAVVARLPFLMRRYPGLALSEMPPLTHVLGPWVEPIEDESRRLAREKELMGRLIEQLPELDDLHQSWHHRMRNWLPFHWAGFSATPRYTYVLEDLSDPDALLSRFRSSHRRNVRKAARKLRVRHAEDMGELIPLVRATFARQGLPMPHDERLLERVWQACRERDTGRILIAEDAQGQAHAGLFMPFDERVAFNLVPAADPKHRGSGAQTLLTWEAIKLAATRSATFDFEGSMIEPIEHFFRGFGASQRVYFRVQRINTRARAFYAARRAALRARDRLPR